MFGPKSVGAATGKSTMAVSKIEPRVTEGSKGCTREEQEVESGRGSRGDMVRGHEKAHAVSQ
eukprot:11600580-Heterocapsa_arctica.AAC.1